MKLALLVASSAFFSSASLVASFGTSTPLIKNGQLSTSSNAIIIPSLPQIFVSPRPASVLFMASDGTEEGSDNGVPILVTGTNIEVTEALKDHVLKKMEKVVGKLASSGIIRECDVHLTVTKNPEVTNSHQAEVTTYLKGMTIRSTMATPDMYGSIDMVSSKLARKLAKYKDRRVKGFHGGANMGQQLADILEEISLEVDGMGDNDIDSNDDFSDEESLFSAEADTYAAEPEITRIKSFDLSKPQSLKEAIFALDYIDHDFYVFRDDATNAISVVYKRNAGGIGLIQPQQ